MHKIGKASGSPKSGPAVLGKNLPFAVAEAYKLLRTNLTFSMPDQGKCKIIGITSAIRGEGKSTTSINIAYTMAQTGKKVLLLEADMRLPTLAHRLQIVPRPGLSNLLVGQCKGGSVLQPSNLLDNLWVITAGSLVPNPSEMLGSAQMQSTLSALADSFDIIIVDLPPVTAVADALLISRIVDGMVIVVRENYCEKKALDETVRKLRFADAKILGFVMNDTKVHHTGHYYKYGSYSSQTGRTF